MAKFSEVLTIINGKNQSKVENPNGAYPIYGSGGIMGYANDYLCEAETVIIGRKGSINKPIFVSEPFWNVDTAFGLAADRTKLLPKYLYYFCIHFNFESLNTTVTIPSLTKANLLNIEMTLPPLSEQQAVVARLSKIDELIALRNEQLTKLDQLVKARFVEMFGDPVKNNLGWPCKTLDDVCDGICDGLHGTPEYDADGDYPFINGNNLIDGKIVVTSATKMVSEAVYKRHFIDIGENAILISINGTLGKLAFYTGERVMLGKSACYCNLKKYINRIFVYGVMSSDAFAEFLENSSTKSTIKNVGLKALRQYQLILPPEALQAEFASFVEQTNKTKLTIQASLDKLEVMKKALMQEYFG